MYDGVKLVWVSDEIWEILDDMANVIMTALRHVMPTGSNYDERCEN